ncbi:DUF4132 domain-containing protein [Spirillospora sp. CA-294931]|uniref:DUF4132 domain-containing protein n=1 Tax=Spirillospora sp. CA-294931 TaxID=3240042 RepID=UPI003D93FD28
MNDVLPPLPDEDALVIPDAWRRHLHPRRGGVPGPAIKVGRTASTKVRKKVEAAAPAIASVLTLAAGDPELAEALRRHHEGESDPVGAAALAVVVSMAAHEDLATFVDAWIADHGAVFAARAMVEVHTLRTVREPGGDWKGTSVGVQRREDHLVGAPRSDLATRVRAVLAAADDATYREAEARLAELRGSDIGRLLSLYLIPTRQDWVDEFLADPPDMGRAGRPFRLVSCSLSAPEQLETTFRFDHGNAIDVLATMAEGLGAALLPLVVRALDDRYRDAAETRTLLEVAAVLPSDEAFQALLDRHDEKYAIPALRAAMHRFPVRALRLLAPAAQGTTKAAATAADLLETHVLAKPELVARVLPELPDDVRAAVEKVRAANVRVPDAPSEAVPEVLLAPPWERPDREIVVEGLTPPEGGDLVWADGERQRWAESGTGQSWHLTEPEDGWGELVSKFESGDLSFLKASGLLAVGPAELVRPLFPAWEAKARKNRSYTPWTRPLVARYGRDMLAMAVQGVKEDPDRSGEVLAPFPDAEAAVVMAGCLSRPRASGHATRWLARHGLGAVVMLVPAALGKPGKRRRDTEAALRRLAERHGADAVVAAARHHGDQAADAVAALLSQSRLDQSAAEVPKPGAWADPALLPQVLLRDRERALPAEATATLLILLAAAAPLLAEGERDIAELDAVEQACDPASLAEFAWAAFRRWDEFGAPSKDGWALTALGRFGDDDTVRRLTPLIRAWPGEGGHKRAVNGLDVLAAIGSDVALMHLHGIAQKVKFKGLQSEASLRIREIAKARGLTAAQLADRLVPTFGLDASGGMTLDYGPRRFTVVFDEQLRPQVLDESGKPRKSLPKPGAKDDPELAPAAHKTFTALKKDVKTVAAGQIRRLEEAMVYGRRWTPEEFQAFFVGHPLMRHLARRLVWLAETGAETTAFRVAEDATLADAADDALTLDATARVGIAHPVTLAGSVGAWAEVFADYEILQPFPQLGRPVYRLTPEEAASGHLARFAGVTVPWNKMLALTARGWDRGAPQGGGNEMWMSRGAGSGLYVQLDLDPGFAVGIVDDRPTQTCKRVWITKELTDWMRTENISRTFGELDEVTASEVLADLTDLADAAV